jgi:hypothetical protein
MMIFKAGRKTCIKNSGGTTWWTYKYSLHRDNGPAVIYFDGEKLWYNHGLMYRRNK